MEFITDFIEKNSSTLIESLSSSGFSAEQASSFLPEAASSITSILNQSSIEQIVSDFTSGGPEQILSSINMTDISSKLGISADMVSSGFESILPAITAMISQNGGGVGEVISSLSEGNATDLLSKAKSLFS